MDDSRSSFPPRETCDTTHAVARRYVKSRFKYGDEKLGGKAKAGEIAAHLSLPEHTDFRLRFGKPHEAHELAQLIKETVDNYLKSADDNLTVAHVPDL